VSALDPDQIVALTEVLVLLMGIAIAWAVYRGSDQAELPGTSTVPSPDEVDDATPDTRGRTLS
jgi:hypothetical protein